MVNSLQITADQVRAHFECRTKAALLAQMVPSDERDIVLDLQQTYRLATRAAVERATDRRLIDFNQLADVLSTRDTQYAIDCQTTFIDWTQLETLLSKGSGRPLRAVESRIVSPIFFCPFDRVPSWHTAILYFAAVAIGNVTGITPAIGFICFGAAAKLTELRLNRLSQHLGVLHEIIAARRADPLQSVELNAHCTIWQFRERCFKIASDADSLSLVSSIPPKERRKLNTKGITTITQLSYTYRPRRKRRPRATARPHSSLATNKNDNRLKALAIRKKQVHIINSELISTAGTPVYFDVEGIPGADTYYLVGMRFEMGKESIERSFWANARAEERDLWGQCLNALTAIDKPQLVHYGSYESGYLARMRERYPDTIKDLEHFESMVERSRNLLKTIYASIYFPTFTNGLKDVARYLGFNWSDPILTGRRAAVLRLQWEIDPREELKQRLIQYNMEDCRATQIVASAIDGFQRELQEGTISTPSLVDIDTLKVPYQRTYGPFATTSPDFRRINNAAYWNYQRERVYVRSEPRIAPRKAREQGNLRQRRARPDKVVYIERTPPARCPKCRRRKIWKAGCQHQTCTDLVFTRKGARRQVVKQRIQRYKCATCREEMGVPAPTSQTGPTLQAYIIYMMIEMRLSNAKIAKHLWDIFGISAIPTYVHSIKQRVAAQLEPLYKRIWKAISNGSLAQVDETKGVVFGGGHYVWVFANMTTVAYVYSPGRDPRVLRDILTRFKGVLVSNFYGAYDSMECAQQKCLNHLMRDINEAMVNAPFNEQVSAIAAGFGKLLRIIVERVDG
jgi:predicted RecB family nuclease